MSGQSYEGQERRHSPDAEAIAEAVVKRLQSESCGLCSLPAEEREVLSLFSAAWKGAENKSDLAHSLTKMALWWNKAVVVGNFFIVIALLGVIALIAKFGPSAIIKVKP